MNMSGRQVLIMPAAPLKSRDDSTLSNTLHYIRHSGAGIGIHEERGVFFRAFLRLGQFQAGHSQPGIQREFKLPVGIGVGRGHQMQLLDSHPLLLYWVRLINSILAGSVE